MDEPSECIYALRVANRSHRQPSALEIAILRRPIGGIAGGASIDQLVSPLEHIWRNDEAQGFGSPHIDR